jgi:hypothetical protein
MSDGGGAEQGKLKAQQAHSPIEVICATLSDFFLFASQHLNDDDIEKLLYVCFKKVVIRYLVFLRDLLVMIPAAAKNSKAAATHRKSFGGGGSNSSSSHRNSGSNEPLDAYKNNQKKKKGGIAARGGDDDSDDENLAVSDDDEEDDDDDFDCSASGPNPDKSNSFGNADDSPLQPEQILKIKQDVMGIIRLHSILKLKIQQAGGNEKVFSTAEEDKEETTYQAFFNNSAANLFGLISDIANRLIMGEISSTGEVDEVIYSHFSITVILLSLQHNLITLLVVC